MTLEGHVSYVESGMDQVRRLALSQYKYQAGCQNHLPEGFLQSICILTQMRQPSDCFRLTKVQQAILYEDNLPFFVRDFFGRISDIPIYERIIHMS